MLYQENKIVKKWKNQWKICKREQRHNDDSICNKIRELIRPKNNTISFTKTIKNNHLSKRGNVKKLWLLNYLLSDVKVIYCS